jgi:hypothetical protein
MTLIILNYLADQIATLESADQKNIAEKKSSVRSAMFIAIGHPHRQAP